MSNIKSALRTIKGTPLRARAGGPVAGILAVLALATVGLTACGGSSSTTTNAAATGATATGGSSTGSSTSTPGVGRGGARFAAMRECLQKNGVALPPRTPGGGRPPGAIGFLGGGAQLPKGVTHVQFEAALKKCGGGGHFLRSGTARFNSPVFRQALTKYSECLRQNGVNVPAPNTSGKGPVFNTKGLNVASPQFKAATGKCRSALVGALRRPPVSG
jgi:hypothetical protein